jgi:hypothetical protein
MVFRFKTNYALIFYAWFRAMVGVPDSPSDCPSIWHVGCFSMYSSALHQHTYYHDATDILLKLSIKHP